MDVTPKTAAAVGAGSLSIAFVSLVSWIMGFWHVTIPPEVGASLATIFSGAGAYFAPRSDPTPAQIAVIKNTP